MTDYVMQNYFVRTEIVLANGYLYETRMTFRRIQDATYAVEGNG